MLDAGTAPRRIGGLTIFSDHADPQLHYVLAEVPHLVADPVPHLSLTLFRGEQSGALLQLDATLAPSSEQLEEVTRTLSADGADVRLGRPDWRAGRVHLAGWLDRDPGEPERERRPVFVTVGTPSLIGDPSVTIAARLDHHAAAIALASLQQGDSLPTAIIFELEMLALGGPLGIEAEADLRAIYDRLSMEGALTTPWLKARLAKTWEELVQERIIRVTVLDESGDVESRRAEALSRVGGEIVAKMFRPSPPTATPPAVGDGTRPATWELGFRLDTRREELDQTARWSFLERSARRITHHAPASLIGILGDRPVDEHVFYADLAAPRREVVVRAEPELAELGVAALDVTLRLQSVDAPAELPANGEPRSDDDDLFASLTPEANEVRLPVRRDPAQPLWYRVRARFDPEKTRAPTQQTPWQLALGSTVVLSPRRMFPPRSLTVATGRLELSWIDHVEVLVRPPDPQEPARTLVLSDATRSARADFLAPGDGPLTVTARYQGGPDEPSLAEAPVEVAAGEELLVLDGPFAPSVQVLVVPLPVPGVLSIVTELELRSEDGGWHQARSVAWDLPDTTPRTVALRRPRGVPGTYHHRSTLVHEDGTVEVGQWVPSEAPTLVVGATGPVDVHRIEVFVLGGPALRGSLAVELELSSGDASTTALLEGTASVARLTLVVPQGRPRPVLTVREVLLDGSTREQQIDDPPARTVLAPS